MQGGLLQAGGAKPERRQITLGGTDLNAAFSRAKSLLEDSALMRASGAGGGPTLADTSLDAEVRRQSRLAYEQCPGDFLCDKLLSYAEVLERRFERKRLNHARGIGRIFSMVAADLASVQRRYILSDEVAAASMMVSHLRSQAIEQSLDLVRLPLPSVWIEWDDAARLALSRVSGLEPRPGATIPERVGLLVRSDPGGRSGWMMMTYVLAGEGPTPTPHVLRFDLDDPGLMAREVDRSPEAPGLRVGFRDRQQTPTGPRRLFSDYVGFDLYHRIPRIEAVRTSLNRVLIRDDALLSEEDFISRSMALRGLGELLDEWPFLLGVLLMLTSVNGVTEEFGIRDGIVLPKHVRRQHGPREAGAIQSRLAKPVEHVTVTMRLSRRFREDPAEVPASGDGTMMHCQDGRQSRRSPRLHWVIGHPRRRGDKVFWCSPHMRGDPTRPMAATHTVNVEK